MHVHLYGLLRNCTCDTHVYKGGKTYGKKPQEDLHFSTGCWRSGAAQRIIMAYCSGEELFSEPEDLVVMRTSGSSEEEEEPELLSNDMSRFFPRKTAQKEALSHQEDNQEIHVS